MKRIIALLLASVMCLTGCATNQKSDNMVSINEMIQETTEIVIQEAETIENTIEIITQTTGITSDDVSNSASNLKVQNLNFMSLNDDNLLRYVEDNVYTSVVEGLNSEKYFVENVEAIYISTEYLEELFYNSQENIYFGYKLSDIISQWGDTKYIFTVNENGQTTVREFEEYDDTYDNVIRNVAIGTGVILVCVTVSVVTGGLGTAPAVSMIFAASAKTGTIMALSSGAIGGAATAITCGIEGKSLDETLKESALSASDGFMWGAIGGAITGGATEAIALKGATTSGLTMNQAAKLQKETKYPLNVIKNFHSEEEANIMIKAGLNVQKVNGKTALVREIDWNLVDDKGRTNLQRVLEKGLAPIGSDGKPLELHHIGQKTDTPLAILTNTEHHAKENYAVLHYAEDGKDITDVAWNKQKKEFWKSLAEMVGNLK